MFNVKGFYLLLHCNDLILFPTGSFYKATCAYEATSSDEMSFPFGAILEVLQKNLEGWWLAW